MHFYAIKNTFNGGELDALVLSRVDIPRYQTGCKILENFVPIPQGGVTRRPGTQFVGQVKNPQAAKNHVTLRPFVFSEVQGRVLELGHLYMRVWLPDGRLVIKNNVPYELALPYTESHVKTLSFAQSADVIYIAHPNYPPAKISRYGDDDWRYEIIQFLPTIQAPTSLTLTPQGSVPAEGSKTYSYKVTAVSEDTAEESAPTAAKDIYASSLSQTYFMRIAWPAVSGALQYRVYKKQGGSYGYIGSTTDLYFDDVNSEVDTADTPPEWQNPFEEEGFYPSIAFFHEQRLGFAASNQKPMTVYLSKTAGFENFSTATPPKPDDAIEATLAAKQANKIHWVEPDSTGLIIGTAGSEWSLQPAEGAALSPLDLAFVPQSSVGSLPNTTALALDSGIIFVQRGTASVRQIAYNFQADKMLGEDLSLLAPHVLRDKELISWAYQQVPHSIIWAVLSDGTLAGLTLMREQEVVAWHRHNTQGFFEDVISIPGAPDDQVWFLVRRKGQLYIEKLAPFFEGTQESAVYVDSSLTYVGEEVQTLAGLTHLENQSVIAYNNGANEPPQIVKNGAITLTHPTTYVSVGLGYTSLLVPTTPETALQNGHSLMVPKRTLALNVQVYKSIHFMYSFDNNTWYDTGDRPLSAPIAINPSFLEQYTFRLPLGAGFQVQDIYLAANTASPLTFLALGQYMDITPEKGGL